MRELNQLEVNAVSGSGVSGETQGGLVGAYIGALLSGGNPLGGLIGGFIGAAMGGAGILQGGPDIRLKYAVQ